MNTFSPRLGHARLDFLDQMRAVAIIPVIVDHYHSDWLSGGGMGVGIFFSLSGFLIGTILLETKYLDGRATGRFILRRFMRIYPAYFMAIVATVALTYIYRPEKTDAVLQALPGLLTFTYQPPWLGYGFGVLWTLQVEISFYVAIPIAMLIFGPRRGVIIAASVLILSSALYCYTSAFSAHTILMFPASLARWGGALALGSLVSLVWKDGLFGKVKIPVWPLVCMSGLGIALLLVPAPTSAAVWTAEVMASSICGCGLIIAFLMDKTLTAFPGTAWIGRISYSLYLIHGIVLDLWPTIRWFVPAWSQHFVLRAFYHAHIINPPYYVQDLPIYGTLVVGLLRQLPIT